MDLLINQSLPTHWIIIPVDGCYTTDFDSDGSFCRLFFPSPRMKRKHIQYIA